MTSTFRIAGRQVGPGCPAYVIAEACDNHMGSLDAALEMARQSKLAGADAVKFQHHLPDEEMLPDTPMSDNFDEPLYEFLKKHALTLDQHRKIKTFCDQIGITYLCTPFSWAAAQELMQFDVPAFKIGSGEMTDVPSLVRIAGFGKPMIVSTGMATFPEIERTYQSLITRGAPLALMNCVSEYPPRYEDVNLGVIQQMSQRFPAAVIGHSDHTPDLFTCYAAITLGACIIEKHVILDKRTPGPDQSVSIDFRDLATLVDGIRKVEAALGNEKKVHHREEQIRTWAFRSIVSTRSIEAGEVITQAMIWSKRPGTGIPSYRMDEVIGRRAVRAVPENSLLSWDDLS
ncbi:CMP-N-acetylneuraminic acid synthetase [Bradyrhizobium sp. CCBAU 11386]|uniref:N-acetylneuraminate synthase family protein n=1 Tax=Bradyrhizobium sp. CCBAU 11386 TaxID=1630837 RepID=UPI002303492B|nr:N-acetylneuraminate synthase family protein [Bradyrhizobium sp. CCBAU 11386]MDA9508844.1 CMP-N-acetylneuraminic acid synthetase [Bradyrhizobium sp. CCBAU 11386]